MLSLMNKEMIQLNAQVEGWEEAIQLGGDLLFESNCIEARYIDAMINNMIENGPYFVLAPGVAMPHASSKDGVKKLSMSLVTLAKPIAFLDTPNNPVELVICLAALDDTSHLDLLRNVSELLSNPEDVRKIITATKVEEVLQIFNP